MVMKIYIAGPMSGIADDNRPAFEAAERKLRELYPQLASDDIFNPIDHEASLMVQQGLVKDTQQAYRMCLKLDLAWIAEHATHMYLLHGWERSYGARAEHALAQALNINFFYEDSL